MRILLAEDNETNRQVSMKLVRALGHTAVAVENGYEAVEHALSGQFDVVLMDVQMPIVDGLEATRRIREGFAERAGRPRIIAVTANALLGDRETCLEAGMDDYIAKPLRLSALKRALGAAATQAEARTGVASLVDDEQLLGVIDPQDAECIEIFDDFCSRVDNSINAIATAVAARDWETVASWGHQLKGSAATMGFIALADWAARVEALAKSGGVRLPDGWQPKLKACFAEAKSIADTVLGREQ